MKILLGKGGPSSQGFHMMQALTYCKKEFQFATIRKIHVPAEFTHDHFAVGSIFHAGRARWFSLNFRTDAKAWRAIKDATAEEADGHHLPVSFKAERMALSYLAQYVEHYSLLPKPKPLAAEYLLGPAPLAKDDPLYMFRTARLDDVSVYPESAGQLAIGESKTTSGSVNDVVRQYQLHGQPMLQYVLWKLAKQGERTHGPVAGTVLDVTVKGYGGRKCSFKRVFIPFEPYAIKWFKKSMRGYLKDGSKIDWNSTPRRNFGSCTRMGGRGRVDCTYKKLCTYGRSVAGQYVYGEDSRPLHFWKPSEGKETPPWE